jgi:NAD(P)-dependent dehydrogenase (short-subunit alcohol dehydrogenase family)
MKLEGKVSIVTGGGQGIGRGIATCFAEAGSAVVIAQRGRETAMDTVKNIRDNGGDATYIQTDVSEPSDVERLIDQTMEVYGKIDVLVNNAAVAGGNGPFLDISLENWRRVIEVNLTGMFLCSQSVARQMVKGNINGKIINIGSLDSFIAERHAAAYAASKGGVLMLTKAMAVDLAEYGILVNCIAPGSIRVERNAPYYDTEPLRTALRKGIPLRHTGHPEDIGAVAVFLASDETGFMTGASIVVDGGFSAYLCVE